MINHLRGKISHIEIYVSDLNRSIEFWGWLLTHMGYDSYQQWDKGRSWIKDGTYIVLVQTAKRFLDREYHRCRTGLNHLAFYAESEEEIDSLARCLQERGIRILYEDRYPHATGSNSYALFFEDPDRIKVEVVLAKE